MPSPRALETNTLIATTGTKADPVAAAPPILSVSGLIVLVAGQLLPSLDFSIVNVALDRIGTDLGVNANGLVLTVAVYGLSFATLLAAGGRLGNRYGRKRLFLVGIAGFCVASGLCGLANNLVTLLTGRLLQGAFGAILLPQILATIHATLQGARHSRAVGIYTAAAGLSVVIGQVLGGWLVSADLFGLGWRLGFFINLPICTLILGFGGALLPETRGTGRASMDGTGMAFFAAFLLCLLLPVALGETWPSLGWLLIGLPPLGAALWRTETRLEAKGGKPLLPPSLFRAPLAGIGLLAEMSVTFCYAGYMFVTALCLQSAIGFTPLQSGNGFSGLGATAFVGSLISKTISDRIGNRYAFVLGSGLTMLGFLATLWVVTAQGSALTVADLVVTSGVVGLGNSFMLTSAFRTTLSHVGKHHASEASVALSTVQQGCFALGTAFAGAVYAGVLPFGYRTALASATLLLCVLLLSVAGTVLRKGAVRDPRGAERG